jgi:hypothetical protein
MKHALLVLLGIGVAVGIGFLLLSRQAGNPDQPTGLTPAPSASPTGNITVSVPVANQTVGKAFVVSGSARTFEQNVVWRVRTTGNVQVASGFTTATAADIGQFGPYSFTVTLPGSTVGPVVLEVFETSAKDGSEVSKVSLPLTVL